MSSFNVIRHKVNLQVFPCQINKAEKIAILVHRLVLVTKTLTFWCIDITDLAKKTVETSTSLALSSELSVLLSDG
jgi:hypothetical protein